MCFAVGLSRSEQAASGHLSLGNPRLWLLPVLVYLLADALIVQHMLRRLPRFSLGIVIPFGICFFLARLFSSFGLYFWLLARNVYGWYQDIVSWLGFSGDVLSLSRLFHKAAVTPMVLFFVFGLAALCLGLFGRPRESAPVPAAPARIQAPRRVSAAPLPAPREAASPPPAKAGGRIQILSGNYAGAIVPIGDGETLRIGRDPGQCQLVLDQDFASLSRLHCTVSYRAAQRVYIVTDCSSHGTFDRLRHVHFPAGSGRPASPGTVLELSKGFLLRLL